MLQLWQGITLIGATLLTGLMAGLYFAFSVAVMPGLRRCRDTVFLSAMRSVNERILNGWFLLAFGGAAPFALAATVLQLGRWGHGGTAALAASGCALYASTLGITFGVNVPLNRDLADRGDEDPAALREHFEAHWTHQNHLRTLLATLALFCLAWALIIHGTANG